MLLKAALALAVGLTCVFKVGGVCSTGDSIAHVISSQAHCTEETRAPTKDCRWPAGLNTNVDQIVHGGEIIAYQIQWFNGAWSGWYVTGVNDIDSKFNPYGRNCSITYGANSMRRVWSYFYDHHHKYIICYNTGKNLQITMPAIPNSHGFHNKSNFFCSGCVSNQHFHSIASCLHLYLVISTFHTILSQ